MLSSAGEHMLFCFRASVCVCFVLSLDVKSMLNLVGNHVCIMHY